MSVFTRDAFAMSSIPAGASSSAAPSGRATPSGSGTRTPVEDPHVVEIDVESVLFDMDGTLINSSGAVVAAWELFKQTYTFLDLDDILKSAHGMRTIDVLKKWCKITDPKTLETEVLRFESAILAAAQAAAERGGGGGIEVLPGVAKLLDDLSADKDHESRGGKEMWAVCTSSTFFYASKAIPTAGLTTPKVFITADSVTNGKPHPEPYIRGAQGCGASVFESLVVEDAPTGIRAGKASGARVLATCTSHSREDLEKERPDFLVEDLSHVSVTWNPETGRFHMIIDQPVGRDAPAMTPDSTPLVTPAVSRAASFSSIGGSSRPDFWKGSDDLTGNDSVAGTPASSRPGSPGPDADSTGPGLQRRRSSRTGPVPGGLGLEAFKKALGANANKRRGSMASDSSPGVMTPNTAAELEQDE